MSFNLWCKSSVRILWRDIWNFKFSIAYQHRFKVDSAILSALVICLPNESKELLYMNRIFILTSTSKSPLFNYATFCKVLSIDQICLIIDEVLEDDKKLLAFDKSNWTDIIPVLKKHSSTLIKLHLNSETDILPLSFVASFPNLQEIRFHSLVVQILKIFEIFKKNLKGFYTNMKNSDTVLAELLTTVNEKSVKTWCGNYTHLNEKEVLETVTKYSPTWKNRTPKKSLTLIIKDNSISLEEDEESMKIIEQYENLGIIKFKTISYDEEDDDKFRSYHLTFVESQMSGNMIIMGINGQNEKLKTN
ncbi:hypothetical protein C1645_875124 [Glomus cerebriforme]|uniref:F-box domain-containing protein n=1 Tax=Glomus cerebriforme TaxID=658196 RepID=A0A397TA94_9GLOM|nr:hypothetical protein C1645_875124 [Glomus cerebriforme]